MTPEFVVNFAQEAIKVTLLVSMPMLLLGLIVGVLISIFQAFVDGQVGANTLGDIVFRNLCFAYSSSKTLK